MENFNKIVYCISDLMRRFQGRWKRRDIQFVSTYKQFATQFIATQREREIQRFEC